MTPEQFWFDDEDNYNAYQKAYNLKINEEKWLTGIYVTRAIYDGISGVLPSAVARGLGSKGNYEHIQYYDSPLGAESKQEEKEDNTEENYRKRVSSWV